MRFPHQLSPRRADGDGPVLRPRISIYTFGVVALSTLAINLFLLALPLAAMQLFDRVFATEAADTLITLVAGVTVALILGALAAYVRAVTVCWQAARDEHAVNQALLGRLLNTRPEELRGYGAGVADELFAAVSTMTRFRAEHVPGLAMDLPFSLLCLALIYVLGGWIAAVPAALVFGTLAVFALGSRAQASAVRCADDLRGRQMNFELETLARMAAIKAAAIEAPMMRRYERLMASGTAAEHRVARARVPGHVAEATLGWLAMVGVAAAGYFGVVAETLSIGELAACTVLAGLALQPLQRACAIWADQRRVALARERVSDGLRLPAARPTGCVPLQRLQGAIALEDVTVRNDAGQSPLLDGITLHIPAGATIGITGDAGSGKSSLLMLVAGMRRPDAGRVKLDGRFDPMAHTEESLLQQVVYVPGQATIFSGTLLDNITMFAPDSGSLRAGRSAQKRDRAHDLADRLGLTTLAARLPMGFNTPIGPGSAYVLPQGLAQRIAVARVFFAAPRILLFDSANTALDSEGDAMVRRLLDEERGTCTMLIVSQRPSLLRIADQVYTLDKGALRGPILPPRIAETRRRVSA